MPTYYMERKKRYNKPPIGLLPKHLHNCVRASQIREAIKRYIDANMAIPSEWVDEYLQLMNGGLNG